MTPHPSTKPAAAITRAILDQPWAWGCLAFAAYFYYAQFIVTVSWNAIELIIAQHLIDHGVFATSVDYPSAITWRPFLPTLLVTLLRRCTADPILIYQIYCGCTLASLVTTSFLSARVLWGRGPAHLAAFLAFTCPAITTQLINQPHSYSHLGGLLLFGPAIYASVRLLRRIEEGHPLTMAGYAAAGVLWGLCYLCRSEFLLGALVFLATALWAHRARRLPLTPLVPWVLAFLAFFLPYNFHADQVARQDGLLIRKVIYGFYASQGWVDPSPTAGPDVEADGYLYAQQLYGTALENGESLPRAILHNPAAFLRRVRLNIVQYYRKLSDRDFFHPWVGGAAIIFLVAFVTGRTDRADRRLVLFLIGLFLTSHFVLIFHIDVRYLTIAVPPLILLATASADFLVKTARRHLPTMACQGLIAAGAAGLLWGAAGQFELWWHHRERNHVSVPALATLGARFGPIIHRLGSTVNREPHVRFVFPTPTSLFPEDQFLVAYFTKTSWVNGGAEGPFPRGRIYSYRDRPIDYLLMPAGPGNGGEVVAEEDIPSLGRYQLVRLRH